MGSHAGFYDINDIIAQFLAFIDEVHVDCADGIGVLVVIDINDVLLLELVAVVVDFVFCVHRPVQVEGFLAA